MSTSPKTIRKTSAEYDRIEWYDAGRRVKAARGVDARSVADVAPHYPVRRFGKWEGQEAMQGHYWCVGTQTMVRHESMMEFTSLMMLDHLFDIAHVMSQPMLLTFAVGRHHTPDFLVDTAQGERILVEVHEKGMTAEADLERFGLTDALCTRVGWRFELIDRVTDVVRWNLEMMARYNHPRYAPDEVTGARILKLANEHRTFGGLRTALATSKPGEHLPAVFHLMWNRAIRFDLHRAFSDLTPLYLV